MAGTPYAVVGTFRFWVEIDGLLVGGFAEVEGLEASLEVEEFQEGGVNGYMHILPKGSKHPPLVLKRGMSNSSELWDWYDAASSGKVLRKSGSVILQNEQGQEVCRWNFFNAYPIRWAGPQLQAMDSSVAIETVEVVHSGIKAIFAK